jgi:hypothetical protein
LGLMIAEMRFEVRLNTDLLSRCRRFFVGGLCVTNAVTYRSREKEHTPGVKTPVLSGAGRRAKQTRGDPRLKPWATSLGLPALGCLEAASGGGAERTPPMRERRV